MIICLQPDCEYINGVGLGYGGRGANNGKNGRGGGVYLQLLSLESEVHVGEEIGVLPRICQALGRLRVYLH